MIFVGRVARVNERKKEIPAAAEIGAKEVSVEMAWAGSKEEKSGSGVIFHLRSRGAFIYLPAS